MKRLRAAVLLCAALAACTTARAPAPQSVAPSPAAPPPGEPSDIAGLKPAQLTQLFGAPAFVRQEGTIQIWRYDAAVCKAFFFLYPYGDALLVRHVETLPRGTVIAADEGCLATLRAHSTAPVS